LEEKCESYEPLFFHLKIGFREVKILATLMPAHVATIATVFIGFEVHSFTSILWQSIFIGLLLSEPSKSSALYRRSGI
jgi:hypothetical protein